MPRLKLNRFRVTEPPDEVKTRYIRVYPGRELHFAPETLPPISAESLFGVTAPLVLDLGCGRGEFLVQQAQANPHRYFVGFEWHLKSVWDAANRANTANLDNVRLIKGDLRLALRRVPDACASDIFMLFPPPPLKPRKRRGDLLTDATLHHIHRVLLPDGVFHFVTDHVDYFAEKRALIAASGLFEIAGESEAFEGGLTRFQRFWEGFAIPSRRLACRKRQ